MALVKLLIQLAAHDCVMPVQPCNEKQQDRIKLVHVDVHELV